MSDRPARKSIGIVAATFTGNRGAEAMLSAVIEQLQGFDLDIEIHVLSYAYHEDSKWIEKHTIKNLYLHSARPMTLVFNWLPLAILGRFSPFLKRPLPSHSGFGIFKLLSLDLVIDLAGVSFMDGRAKFLPFNVLTLWPFLLHEIPVVKLSQAMGPMKRWITRFAARFVLPQLKFIGARGDSTECYLKECGIASNIIYNVPDTSFCLRAKLNNLDVRSRERDLCIIPSSLVDSSDLSYRAILVETICELLSGGWRISLIAHSWRTNPNIIRNNDVPLCLLIAEEVEKQSGKPISVIGPGLCAVQLKEEISRYKLCLSSRFHGMIGAIDTETPVLVLGWSHKYVEVLDQFGIGDCSINRNGLTKDQLLDRIRHSYRDCSDLQSRMHSHLEKVREASRRQFSWLQDFLVERNSVPTVG